MSRVALFSNPACALHDPGAHHSDHPGRLAALIDAVRADPALARILYERVAPPAGEEDLLRVHDAGHVRRVREDVASLRPGQLLWLDADTAVSAGSWDAALAAAGCACFAAEAVLDGSATAAFALSR
ncbi:MAG TPA: histone deacetylase, partial [Anaeromyxobacteraceae bacterium]|nr:histone deacetylase [Anaeromyxobacteraceae bacterium]